MKLVYTGKSSNIQPKLLVFLYQIDDSGDSMNLIPRLSHVLALSNEAMPLVYRLLNS